MYEHHREKILHRRKFAIRVAQHGGVVLAAVIVALAIGIVGYHLFAGLSWIDALLNAAMILGGMGPVNPMVTNAGKLFASFYALYSGMVFLVAAGVLVTPAMHRIFHHFHLVEPEDEQPKEKR